MSDVVGEVILTVSRAQALAADGDEARTKDSANAQGLSERLWPAVR